MSPEAVRPIQDVLHRWILTGQALVGSIGALAFIFAFLWKMVAMGTTETIHHDSCQRSDIAQPGFTYFHPAPSFI